MYACSLSAFTLTFVVIVEYMYIYSSYMHIYIQTHLPVCIKNKPDIYTKEKYMHNLG